MLETPFYTHEARCAAVEKSSRKDLEDFKEAFLTSLTIETLAVRCP